MIEFVAGVVAGCALTLGGFVAASAMISWAEGAEE